MLHLYHMDLVNNYCVQNVCKNGATCINTLTQSGQSNYTCNCAPNWSNKNCTTFNYCSQSKCAAGSTCVNQASDYTCSCNTGSPLYQMGTYCNQTNYCTQNVCKNGATCINTLTAQGASNYTCNCAPNWSNKNCTTFNY
jgi:hypothetical protein